MQPEPQAMLRQNLASLAASDPHLAALISTAAPAPDIDFLSARNGSVVPAARGAGASLPLHSLVDPQKEAQRIYETARGAGYLACLGLGGGYVAAVFVDDPAPVGLLVVERDCATLRALFERISFAPLLADRRVRLVAGAQEIRGALASSFLPAVAQDIRTIPLRPWCEREREFFRQAADQLRAAVEEARADFGTQAAFGKRWFTNSILNVAAMRPSPQPAPRASEIHVTAAGPSLEAHVEALSRRPPGSLLFATDTSLPALLRFGVRPDAAISVDCQVHSYHHFLSGAPQDMRFFFDLAAPPFLARSFSRRAAFFAGAHPFSRLVSSAWMRLPDVDTTGGNVTHAAVSLAARLGARRILVHGADFSYPRGKPYARGTYLFDHFGIRESRLAPLETPLFAFVRRSEGLARETSGGLTRYSTPLLRDYRLRFERLCAIIDAEVILSPGDGVEISVPRRGQPDRETARAPNVFAGWNVGPSAGTWQDFLSEYAGRLSALPSPAAPLGRYMAGLTEDQRSLWYTVLPIAATVLRERGEETNRAPALLEARTWALRRVERLLAGG